MSTTVVPKEQRALLKRAFIAGATAATCFHVDPVKMKEAIKI